MMRPTDRPTDRPTFLSLFSGVGGFDCGLERAGWVCVGQVELDAAATRVLAVRWPHTPRWRDVRDVRVADGRLTREGSTRDGAGGRAEHDPDAGRIDLLVGGFPCQDYSVAGKRAGLAGDRGALFWQLHRLAQDLRPAWGLFENVPGLISSRGGRDFWTILTALRECWPAVGYRILDSRYFGVAQRRRRVFIVCGPDEARVAEVLFERPRGGGHPAPGDEAGACVAASLTSGAHGSGVSAPGRRHEDDVNLVVGALNANKERGGWRAGPDEALAGQLVIDVPEIAWALQERDAKGTDSLRAEGHDASEDGAGRGTPLVAHSLRSDAGRDGEAKTPSADAEGRVRLRDPGFNVYREEAPTVDATAPHTVAFQCHGTNVGEMGTLREGDGGLTSGVPFVVRTSGHCGSNGLGVYEHGDAPTLDAQENVGIAFREAQKAHDPEDCERWEEADATDAVDERDARTANAVVVRTAVRRLTPTECERLQGFPDGWTCLDVPRDEWARDPGGAAERCACADSPRYRQMGNAVTVPVVEWIGGRMLATLSPGGHP